MHDGERGWTYIKGHHRNGKAHYFPSRWANSACFRYHPEDRIERWLSFSDGWQCATCAKQIEKWEKAR